MTFNFPELELSPPQRLWLEEAYARFKRGERTYLRQMKLAMWGRVPKGFDHQTIDPRLLRNGCDPTLLGIWHVDPKSDVFENTDKVIRAVRDWLLSDHEKENFKATEVAAVTNVPADEVARVFELLFGLGRFWHSRSSGSGEQASISLGELHAVEEYLNYDSLEETVQRAFIKQEPRNNSYIQTLTQTGSQDDESEPPESHPIFRSRVTEVDRGLCFVLMPFHEEWSDRVYLKLIRKTVEQLGLQCLRADDLYGQIIIEDIWVKINQCAFVIVDVTTRNPNVMYELGIVHTIGKPSVLITQNVSQIPFDFTHHRHLVYEDNLDGFAKLAEQLPMAIKEIYRESYPESLVRLS